MADPDEQNDEQLMRAVKHGDADALAALFERHAPLLMALGRRILGADAEDVVSEVFWEVWDKSSRYEPRRGSVKSYLVLVMRSRCLDRLRARKARPDVGGLSTDGHPQADPAPPPDRAAEAGERSAHVRQAVRSLDEAQRTAIEMSFYEGLSHREIADRLNTPLGTVKGRLRSGLIRLRRSLRRDKEDEVTH